MNQNKLFKIITIVLVVATIIQSICAIISFDQTKKELNQVVCQSYHVERIDEGQIMEADPIGILSIFLWVTNKNKTSLIKNVTIYADKVRGDLHWLLINMIGASIVALMIGLATKETDYHQRYLCYFVWFLCFINILMPLYDISVFAQYAFNLERIVITYISEMPN